MSRIHVCTDADLKEGEPRMVRVGNAEVMVVRSEGKLYAIDGWCSHMRAPLDRGQIREGTVRCRVHGAIFDLATGKVLQNPQAKDMRVYPVTVEGGEVYFEH